MPITPEQARINGRKSKGRPPSKEQKLTRANAYGIATSGHSPVDVMLDNMLFWHGQVMKLANQVERFIVDADSDESRAEAMRLLRTLLAAREQAQVCAVDLAPYIHAKLASVKIEDKRDSDEFSFTLNIGSVGTVGMNHEDSRPMLSDHKSDEREILRRSNNGIH